MTAKPDIIVPVRLDERKPTETIIREMLEQKERYGITRFMLNGPAKGWRSIGYPPREHFTRLAEQYNAIVEALAPHGIECGWWCFLTVKSGRSASFGGIVRRDGSEHPFANCPLDPAFQTRLAEDIAYFARVAHPAFIITEDDYSVSAADGCFCKYHIDAFSRMMDRRYTREEIVNILSEDPGTPLDGTAGQRYAERAAFERAWRKLKHDTMTALSVRIREALDRETPWIPMGYMQAGTSDQDGNSTEDIARALAGPAHEPFVRFYGTSYCGIDVKRIPAVTYHAVYGRQHIRPPFRFYQEADAYPHNRFYMAGSEMKCLMATFFSQGFDGATFQTQNQEDDPNEEHIYGDVYARERPRFEAVCRIAARCERRGVGIGYDPFINTFDRSARTLEPLWLECVSRFCIPYTTLEEDIAFWDVREAVHSDEDKVLRALSKGLFLDGDAAAALCRRGYGRYLGADVKNRDLSEGMVRWDLDAHEVIRAAFTARGREIPGAQAYSPPGSGKMLSITVTDPACKVLTDNITYDGRNLGPGMTRFLNSLGGHVVIMGLTLDGNRSPALFSYRRQRLVHDLIEWMGGGPAFVKDAPMVSVIMNEAKDPAEADLTGMLTLISLCADTLPGFALRLPEKWRGAARFSYIGADGREAPLAFSRTGDGIAVKMPLAYLSPAYIILRP